MVSVMKTGYKQTEIGVIPEDWEVKTIFEIADKKKELFNDGDWIEAEHITNDGIRLIQTGNIGIGSFVEKENKKYILQNSFEKLACKELKIGDLLICRLAEPAGRACVFPDINEDKAITSVDVTIFRPRNEIANRDFLSNVFSTTDWFKSVSDMCGGTTHKRISRGALGRIKIPLPPLPEQTAIAAALSDVDALMGELDKLIAKKRDIKQATMQQLLTGKKRLVGFSGEWEVKTIFEIADKKKELFDDGDWIESEHITNDGIRLIQTGNIGIGNFLEKENKKYIFEESFEKLACKKLKVGDLLICRLAEPAGRACVLPDINEDKVITSVDVTIFRPRNEIADRNFLSNVFSTTEWFKSISDMCGGTTHKRISRGALGKIKILLPPIEEQTAIATILSDMDAEINALQQKRDKTAQLKAGMMQELLTGRIRLISNENTQHHA